MKLIETGFDGLYILEPKVIDDDRGFFMESYNKQKLLALGIDYTFVQDNHSKSSHGVIRGLHFQNPPYAQTKLIRVVQGVIQDIVVDIRKSSPTYGNSYCIELSAENMKQLLVPKGFAHGFSTLSEAAEIIYKCDEYYYKDAEGGILYNDSVLKLDWKIKSDKEKLSEKDLVNPKFMELNSKFD